MKNFKLFTFMILLAFISACDSEETPPTGNNASTGDYYPTAVNNEWTYSSGSSSYTSSLIAAETINNQLYYRFDNYSGVTASGTAVETDYWIRKDQGDYILRLDLDGNNGAYQVSMVNPVEIVLLQDYAQVGESWTSTANFEYTYTPLNSLYPNIPNVVSNTEYRYTMLQRDLTVTVQGVTYTEVLEVESVTSVPGATPVELTIYYAKDVGVIKTVAAGGNQELTNYTLY